MKKPTQHELLKLVRSVAGVRGRDMTVLGASDRHVWVLYRPPVRAQDGDGAKTAARPPLTESQQLAKAAGLAPDGVICLLSALRFHKLIPRRPRQVWMAVGPGARVRRGKGVSLRRLRYFDEFLTVGVEEHVVEGATVRVYHPAKTVVDCFKYLHEVGPDVALEALRNCVGQQKATMEDIWRYAKLCHSANMMRMTINVLTHRFDEH